ncbi:MAG TPA: energy transducer TonB [Gemmatimonadaceae bacterium]|nr:energy transducer TonB [Gemmatimonadaceae bacterium]
MWLAATVLLEVGVAGCVTKDDAKAAIHALAESRGEIPDQLPVMRNHELPFKYPQALYKRRVQGNVVLRIFIDSTGTVHPESTMVLEATTIPVVDSQALPALDSAALTGSRELLFAPAKLRGRPVPVTIKFPVYFRHPKAAPPPGDSILHPGSK